LKVAGGVINCCAENTPSQTLKKEVQHLNKLPIHKAIGQAQRRHVMEAKDSVIIAHAVLVDMLKRVPGANGMRMLAYVHATPTQRAMPQV
jgi:hypothetical protein